VWVSDRGEGREKRVHATVKKQRCYRRGVRRPGAVPKTALFVSLVYCAESTVRWFIVREKYYWIAADSADKSKRTGRTPIITRTGFKYQKSWTKISCIKITLFIDSLVACFVIYQLNLSRLSMHVWCRMQIEKLVKL
jgi:hypothetical protein